MASPIPGVYIRRASHLELAGGHKDLDSILGVPVTSRRPDKEKLKSLPSDERARIIRAWVNRFFRVPLLGLGFRSRAWRDAVAEMKEKQAWTTNCGSNGPEPKFPVKIVKSLRLENIDPHKAVPSEESYSVEDVKVGFAKYREEWRAAYYHSLKEAIDKANFPPTLNKIVCVCLGWLVFKRKDLDASLDGKSGCSDALRDAYREIFHRHVVAAELADMLKLKLKRDIAVYAQDDAYTPVFVQALKETWGITAFGGIEACYDHYEGLVRVDDDTLVYHPSFEPLGAEILCGFASPAAMICRYVNAKGKPPCPEVHSYTLRHPEINNGKAFQVPGAIDFTDLYTRCGPFPRHVCEMMNSAYDGVSLVQGGFPKAYADFDDFFETCDKSYRDTDNFGMLEPSRWQLVSRISQLDCCVGFTPLVLYVRRRKT